jgi:hypothetical protein
MFLSKFMPCEDCGASLEREAAGLHVCDPERLADYQLFGLRHLVADFDSQLVRFLASPLGRFEVWMAARRIRGTQGPQPG